MLDPLYQAIGWLLAFFYGLVPNLGVAIILLTATVMLLLFPLTAKQARSMLAMQEIQPELKKIQAKYKGDRQKMVEEQQKLFQEHKVNPLGGCLPLLAQFPVFISLFSVLRSTYKNVPESSDLFRDLCSPHKTVDACGAADGYPKHLEFLGMDLSVTPLNAEGGFFTVLPYFVLVALIVLTGLFQSRQTQRTTPKGGANPQMQMIGRVLPIVFGVISLNFPAGLCVYFLVSNVWRLGQQEVIFRRIHLPHRERKEAEKRGGGAKAAAIDVESRPAPSEPAPEESPRSEPPAPAQTPAPSGGGRLRGLFGLPAAPNGEPAPARPAPAGKPAPPGSSPAAGKTSPGGGGGGSRSNQARRKRNKKRKR
ncbi:MAG: YidC/Oxa1 family membrane protein insertase [Actinomycetota bacterium]